MKINKEVENIIEGHKQDKEVKERVLEEIEAAIFKGYPKTPAFILGLASETEKGFALDTMANTDKKGANTLINMMNVSLKCDKKRRFLANKKGEFEMTGEDFVDLFKDLLNRFCRKEKVPYILGWLEESGDKMEVSVHTNLKDDSVMNAWDDIKGAIENKVGPKKKKHILEKNGLSRDLFREITSMVKKTYGVNSRVVLGVADIQEDFSSSGMVCMSNYPYGATKLALEIMLREYEREVRK